MWSPSIPDLSRPASALIIVALVIAGLYVGRDILIPLTLAAFLSILLAPGVRWFVNIGLPRSIASIGAVLTVVLLLIGGAWFLAHQVTSFAEELPKYELTIRSKVRAIADMLHGSGSWRQTSELLQRLSEDVAGAPAPSDKAPAAEKAPRPTPISGFVESVRSAIPTVATLGLALLFTIFILLQYQEIRDRIVRVMGSHEIGRSSQALNAAANDLGQFFLLQVSLNVAFGVFIGMAMWLIGIPNPGVWGLLAALMRFVPYIGAIISSVLPVVVAAAVDPGWWKLLATAGVFIVADLVVGQFIEPLLFGRKTRLSPFAVLFAVVFWTSVWGPLGLLLAVPLTLALVVFGEHIPQLSPLALVLGNSPALKPHERLYHLLSAGDVPQAIREAESYLEENAIQRYLDDIVLPAFRLGAEDQRRGVLERAHVDRLEQSVVEFTEMLTELIELKYVERDGEFERPEPREEIDNLYFVPGRGLFDHATAKLVAVVVGHETMTTFDVASLGGLTTLGEIASQEQDKRPDAIALVSVGGLTRSQLALLVRRSQRDLPQVALMIAWLGGVKGEQPSDIAQVRHATSVENVIDVARAMANESGERAQAPPSRTELSAALAAGEQSADHLSKGTTSERQVLVAD